MKILRSLLLALALGFPLYAVAQDVSYPPTTSVGVTSLPPLPAGNNNVGDFDVANTAGTNPVPVQGNVAHDAATSGNPVLLGGEARSNLPAIVANGDAVKIISDLFGRLLIVPHIPPSAQVHARARCTSTTSAVTLRAAQGAGVRNNIAQLILSNSSATGTPVTITDGTFSKLLFSPANSYVPVNNDIPWRFAENAAITATTSVSVNEVVVEAVMFTTIN